MAGRNKRASLGANNSSPFHARPPASKPADAAAGHACSAFEIRDNGLWARVKFTPKAAEMIRSDEYRYTSPVWLFNRPDPVTGQKVPARFHSIALTNTPFQDGLSKIELSEGNEAWVHVAKEGYWRGHPSGEFKVEKAHILSAIENAKSRRNALVLDYEHNSLKANGPNPASGWIELSEKVDMSSDEMLGQLSAILGFEGEVDAEALLEKIKALVEASMPKAEPEEKAKPEEKKAEGPKEAAMSMDPSDPVEVETHAALDKIAGMLGMDAAALAKFLADNAEAIAALAGEPKPEESAPEAAPMSENPALAIALSQNAMLREELSAYRVAEADRDIDKAIACGIAFEKQREALRKLYLSDRANFKALTDASTPVPMGRQSEPVALSDVKSSDDFTRKESKAIELLTQGGAMSREAAERMVKNARRK